MFVAASFKQEMESLVPARITCASAVTPDVRGVSCSCAWELCGWRADVMAKGNPVAGSAAALAGMLPAPPPAPVSGEVNSQCESKVTADRWENRICIVLSQKKKKKITSKGLDRKGQTPASCCSCLARSPGVCAGTSWAR